MRWIRTSQPVTKRALSYFDCVLITVTKKLRKNKTPLMTVFLQSALLTVSTDASLQHGDTHYKNKILFALPDNTEPSFPLKIALQRPEPNRNIEFQHICISHSHPFNSECPKRKCVRLSCCIPTAVSKYKSE